MAIVLPAAYYQFQDSEVYYLRFLVENLVFHRQRRSMLTARQFCCALCHQLVQICSCCDHGNIYCSNQCAAIARKNSVRQANKRYQNTRRGKSLHAQRQRRYKQQQHDRLNGQNEKMTDHGSENIPALVSLSSEQEKTEVINEATNIVDKTYCHFCGRECANLLRIDFLQTSAVKKTVSNFSWAQGP